MNKPELPAPSCPYCGAACALTPRVFQVRRGDRLLAVDLLSWECPSGCADPGAGTAPFRFSDAALGAWCDTEVRRAWRARFGEELPERRPPGRKPETPRPHRVTVLLSDAELAELDAAATAAALPRGEVIRRRALG